MNGIEILIIAFGLPSVTLLTGIFFKLGKTEEATAHNTQQIDKIWAAIQKMEERFLK